LSAPRPPRWHAARIWDLTKGAVKLDLTKEFLGMYSRALNMGAAAFADNGKLLALGQNDEAARKVYLASLATGKKVRELVYTTQGNSGITGIVPHPDGRIQDPGQVLLPLARSAPGLPLLVGHARLPIPAAPPPLAAVSVEPRLEQVGVQQGVGQLGQPVERRGGLPPRPAVGAGVVILEALPRTRSGKIMRRYLKARELGIDAGEDAPGATRERVMPNGPSGVACRWELGLGQGAGRSRRLQAAAGGNGFPIPENSERMTPRTASA
jgi:hypothetical protein